MCGTDAVAAIPKRRPSPFLLLTHDSYVIDDIDKDDANKRLKRNPFVHGLGGPTLLATLLTVAFYTALLFLLENLSCQLLERWSYLHPIFEVARNRAILARHVVVDFFPLMFCAWIAVTNRSVCGEMIRDGLARGKSDGMREDGFEERIFKYHPGSQRLLLIFFVYQVKNMYDTILWGDGIAFVIHHAFAGLAAWGGLFPGCCHFYAVFYFGFSEVSTGILCLLANFDPEFGIDGLGEAFPKTKYFLGALFVTSFVTGRVICWPYVTSHYFRDSLNAIESDHPLADGRRGYLRVVRACATGLSLLQLLFVGMLVKIGREEYANFAEFMGFGA